MSKPASLAINQPAKRPVGAPKGSGSKYTPEIADEIIRRLSAGELLAHICREDGMPDRTTVWHWEHDEDKQDFAQRLARARSESYDAIAAECVAIADTFVEGVKTKEFADGTVETQTGDTVERSKLMVETRLKLLAVWDRARYGPTSQQTNVNVGVAVTVAMPEDRRARIMELRRANRPAVDVVTP